MIKRKKVRRRIQTAGETKARKRERGAFRMRVLATLSEGHNPQRTSLSLARQLVTTPQRVVSALVQLERLGEVYRIATGLYRRSSYSEV